MFTRTEVSQLLNIELKNIPYLVSSLGLEPIRTGKKYSNTFYDGIQLIKMKLAIFFKELGLSYEFTKRYIDTVEKEHGSFRLTDNIWVNFKDLRPYAEDIEKLRTFASDSTVIRRRVESEIINKSFDEVEIRGNCYYLILSSSDFKEIIGQLVENCVRLEIETIRPPDQTVVRSELIENAKQHGIDTRKVEVFFNQAA